jgi:hypothetical protein
LRGFFQNFTFAAAHERAPEGQPWRRALARSPWNRWRLNRLRWRDVGRLRWRYRLNKLGGLSGAPRTQQRLPFFKMSFGRAPLTILGVDTGVAGTIDDWQYGWLERCLEQARAANHFIFVLLSAPLYVDGRFAGRREPPEHKAVPRASYGMREVYELLREHKVEVVMGGDTHAYQRYTARYRAPDGTWNTMYHYVNGGGGAYLSAPMDIDERFDLTGRRRLARRHVFQARPVEGMGADAEQVDPKLFDTVRLDDLFPTADQMVEKFIGEKGADEPIPSWLAKPGLRWLKRLWLTYRRNYTRFMLYYGWTNALDHDRSPLLQSYVSVGLSRDARDEYVWTLQIVPWFSAHDEVQPIPQLGARHVVTLTRNLAPSNGVTQPAEIQVLLRKLLSAAD